MARSASSNGRTPTQIRILEMLADGLPHTFEELHTCLDDELASRPAVSMHISNLRKVLRPKGEDIVCVIRYHRSYYQHVRLLRSSHQE